MASSRASDRSDSAPEKASATNTLTTAAAVAQTDAVKACQDARGGDVLPVCTQLAQNPQLPAPLTVFRHPYDSRKQIETIEAGYYQDEIVVGADYGARLITTAASGAAGLG